MFIRPCEGRLTSGFRTKDRPDHHGIDLAQSGIVKVKSIAEGKITKSYTSTSYGEVVFVLHHLDGQEWESVYAHLREGSRTHKVGDIIRQGEVLGLMGNTGRSFGQHLHFEIHRGRWDINKTKALDPYPFIQEKEEVKPVANKNDIKGHWAEKSIEKAKKKKIINGYKDGSFKPDEPLTRAQFAAILDRLGLLD